MARVVIPILVEWRMARYGVGRRPLIPDRARVGGPMFRGRRCAGGWPRSKQEPAGRGEARHRVQAVRGCGGGRAWEFQVVG